uniref:Uncharacterized protein n=1 Tax=Arundo donax TaxID=35708 RepID=A0A0A9FIR9_ARUDO
MVLIVFSWQALWLIASIKLAEYLFHLRFDQIQSLESLHGIASRTLNL